MLRIRDLTVSACGWRKWLPTPGNIVFTLLLVFALFGAHKAVAVMLPASASSTTTIPYQGRLATSSGTALDGQYGMTFALYDTPTGPSSLWSETYSGVQVVDGLFSVLLGSQNPIPVSVITDNTVLYVGLNVAGDGEMSPRTELGSVPYAILAQTVPDYAVTSSKIMTGSITSEKLAPSVQVSLPSGAVILWSGSIASVPSGWQLCNGTNGTPDLRNRFVVGAGSTYNVDDTGGAAQVTLSTANMPAHSHTGSTGTAGGHSHEVRGKGDVGSGADGLIIEYGAVDNENGFIVSGGSHTHSVTISNSGSGQSHENRPPYYSLAYICKQ